MPCARSAPNKPYRFAAGKRGGSVRRGYLTDDEERHDRSDRRGDEDRDCAFPLAGDRKQPGREGTHDAKPGNECWPADPPVVVNVSPPSWPEPTDTTMVMKPSTPTVNDHG